MSKYCVSRFVHEVERLANSEMSILKLEAAIDFRLRNLRSQSENEEISGDAEWAGVMLCALDVLDKSHRRYGFLAARFQQEIYERRDRRRRCDGIFGGGSAVKYDLGHTNFAPPHFTYFSNTL